MPATQTRRLSLAWVLGRLDGLAGTVRYDMPDALRAELREIADRLREIDGDPDGDAQ